MYRPLRIIYLIAESSPYGSNVALLNLLDEITPKEVMPIVVMAGKGGLCELLTERKVPYHQIKYYYSVYPKCKNLRDFILYLPILARTILYNNIAIRLLTQLAQNFKADIIHTNIGPLDVGFKAAKKLHIPHVWHIREYQDLYIGCHPLYSTRGFIKKLGSENNYPIAITKGLFGHYSMRNNASVIYDGVMTSSQTQFIPQKEKYFLFVGRLEEAKGIRQLITAFIEFARKDSRYNLLIAGDGAPKFKSTLFQIVDNGAMRERIKFLGFRADVNTLMARATALIVASSYEGFGFTTVEAMFNGCLVIGKNSGGTQEIIKANKLGILYNDHNELVVALYNIVNSGIECFFPTIRKAQEFAAKNFSSEKSTDEVYRLYESVVVNKIKSV